jgi:hypothetical protein
MAKDLRQPDDSAMTDPSSEDRPPAPDGVVSAAEIAHNQNTLTALELLIAQRRMYRYAKRWNYLRLFGIGVIAIAVPIATMINSDAAVIGLAVAGGWAFLARTWFVGREILWNRRAAVVQEAFDTLVFGLPYNLALAEPLRQEWIADVIGDDDVAVVAEAEYLVDWYSLDEEIPAAPAVAICQRSNSAYSERLLSWHAIAWICGATAWTVIAIVLALTTGVTVREILLGVVLPILPAALDARDQWATARDAAADRARLADEIGRRVQEFNSKPLSLEDLRQFQDVIYRQRRDGPLVPEFLYRYLRPENERAMNRAASALQQAIISQQQHSP